MIDIDRMEEQLASALNGAGPARRSPVPAPEPTPAPAPASTGRRHRAQPAPPTAVELLAAGRLDEADAVVAASAHPRDALTWATMRALLDGRRAAVMTGIQELRRLAERTDDAEALDRYWAQRFWAAFEWGATEERYDLVDHCRTRAYRFDDLQWWGHLALLLAAMGKHDEATRAFDVAAPLVASSARNAGWLDASTNLAEAAALLGDPGRVAAVARSARWPAGGLVVVGAGVVCKGSIDRYRAMGSVALGRPAEAVERFRHAESVHHDLGAGPLLARTRQQAAGVGVAA